VTQRVLIRGARPYGEGEPVDVLVADGIIAEIGAGLDAGEGAEVVEGAGQVLLPGFVDLHTHLREPGREDAETVATGSAAAALGGYTAVFAMANTDPVADNQVVVEHVRRAGEQVGLVDVHPVGAVTVGLRGEQLAEMGTMAASAAQVRMFSDDGRCVLALMDVKGSGLPPAYLIAITRALLHEVGPAEPFDRLLSRLNRATFANLFEGLDECVEAALIQVGPQAPRPRRFIDVLSYLGPAFRSSERDLRA
jgi:hypothetical protein